MARKRGKKSALDSEFAKPIFGMVLIGLIYLAVQIGLVGWVSNMLVAPLEPTGPKNAGEIYRQQIEKGQHRLTGSDRETGV
jgi:hypothetical protein